MAKNKGSHNNVIEKQVKRAAGYRPDGNTPVRDRPRTEGIPNKVTGPLKQDGNPVWHGVTGNRFAFPLPPESKGPERAREARRKKGVDGY